MGRPGQEGGKASDRPWAAGMGVCGKEWPPGWENGQRTDGPSQQQAHTQAPV